MTAPDQQPHPWNCGMCRNHCDVSTSYVPIDAEELTKMRSTIQVNRIRRWSNEFGCASHHLARRNDPATIAAAARVEGAREERERVLNTLLEWSTAMTVIHNFAEKTDYGWRQAMEQLREKIKYIGVSESLRSQQPGGEDGGAGK